MASLRPMRTTVNSTVWANRSNGQLLTHSNHLGTHLDGEIHFFTPGKAIASLDLDNLLTGPATVSWIDIQGFVVCVSKVVGVEGFPNLVLVAKDGWLRCG